MRLILKSLETASENKAIVLSKTISRFFELPSDTIEVSLRPVFDLICKNSSLKAGLSESRNFLFFADASQQGGHMPGFRFKKADKDL